MQKVTNQQIYDRWEQIPETLREAFLSMDNGGIIWKTCEDAGLPEEVIDNVLIVVGNVIFGFTHINDLAKEMQSIPGMDPKAVDPIIFQIDRKIFAPIKGEILKLYRDVSGTEPKTMMETGGEAVKKEEVQGVEQPIMVSENAPTITQPRPEAVSEEIPPASPVTQFETRKVKIEEETPEITIEEQPKEEGPAMIHVREEMVEVEQPVKKIEEKQADGPAMIHSEEVAAPVVSKKRSLSSFGSVFGFHRKSSGQNEGPAVAAQVSVSQGMGRKPGEMERTEQPAIRVVHYTSAQGPEDMFGQPTQRIQQEATPSIPVVMPEYFEPKVVTTPEPPIVKSESAQGMAALVETRPEFVGSASPSASTMTQESRVEPAGIVQSLSSVVPPIVVMKTPQRPEPVDGVKRQEPEPRLTEIPVTDDVVDLRTLERAGK